MGFSVNPRALAGLPPLLDHRAEELDSCAGYLDIEAVIADLGAAAATEPLRHAHQRVVAAAHAACAGHAETLRHRADAVRAALRGYATSDLTSAVAWGTTAARSTTHRELSLSGDHGQLSGTADQRLGPDLFDASWIVADQLRFPPDSRAEYPASPVWTGPLSLSHAQHRLLALLDDCGGVAAALGHWTRARDERWIPALAGDWPGCYASAYAFTSFVDALNALDDDLRTTAHRVGRVWTGPAAADCATTLLGDAARAGGIGYPMIELAACYRSAAAAAHAAATAVESLRGALVDQAGPAIGVGAGILTIGPLVEIGTAAQRRLARARAASLDAARTTDRLASSLTAQR